MRTGIVSEDGVLRHQDSGGGNVGRRCANAPSLCFSVYTCAVEELAEYEGSRLVFRRFSHYRDYEAENTDGVEEDGGVDHVAKSANAEQVNRDVGDEDNGQDTEGLPCSAMVAVADICCG